MRTISILGSTGVLGSAAAKYFQTDDSYEVILIQRGKQFSLPKLRYFENAYHEIEQLVESLPQHSYILNCIGIIKQKSNFETYEEKKEAFLINSMFPRLLDSLCTKRNIRAIQVATDCVYSGKLGNYNENSERDPIDYYGLSKAIGEEGLTNTSTFRCSFIGKEQSTSFGILNWVLSQPYGASVNGYINHRWNGLTVLQVMQIIDGQIKSNNLKSKISHVIPSDVVTKFELVSTIAKNFNRQDLNFVPTRAEFEVDRTLSTSQPLTNEDFWDKTAYRYTPTIDEMILNYSKWC